MISFCIRVHFAYRINLASPKGFFWQTALNREEKYFTFYGRVFSINDYHYLVNNAALFWPVTCYFSVCKQSNCWFQSRKAIFALCRLYRESYFWLFPPGAPVGFHLLVGVALDPSHGLQGDDQVLENRAQLSLSCPTWGRCHCQSLVLGRREGGRGDLWGADMEGKGGCQPIDSWEKNHPS